MSSIELGQIGIQSSNRPGDQDTSSSTLRERELDDASGDVDSGFWEAPVPNRLTAAFQIGRFFNQLSWHLQHTLLSRNDESMVGEVLDRLVAISSNPVVNFPNDVAGVIAEYRAIWKEWVLCEPAADEAGACYDDDQLRRYSQTSEGCRRELVEVRVQRPLCKRRDRIFEMLSKEERWAFDLGRRLDEGLRRSDVHRFFDEVVSVYEIPSAVIEDGAYGSHLESRLTRRSFKPGELEPDTAWTLDLQQLLAKSGVPVAATATTLKTWQDEDPQNRKSTLPHLLERLDHIIRDHLDEGNVKYDGGDVPVVLCGANPVIKWRGMRYPVAPETAEAFTAMLDAKGQPVGIGSGRYVRKPSEWLKNLSKDSPELAKIVAR